MNRTAVGLMMVGCLVTGAETARGNSIVNGTFSAGNTGFSSAYGFVPPASIFAPATYSIVHYDTLHPSWDDFTDHTTGGPAPGDPVNGRYMIVNGTDTGLGPTWKQDQTLAVGRYELSAWFASLFAQSPASLQFRVVDSSDSVISSSPTFTAPLPTGVWDDRSLTFDITTAGTFSIQIWDTNDAFTGNDYAIDDISLIVVPLPPAAWAGLGSLACVAGFGVVRRRRLSAA
jgi:hypothetical protein